MGFQKEGENIYEVISEEDNKEEDFILKAILEDLNKNIIINVKEQEEVQKQTKDLLIIIWGEHTGRRRFI